jgi:hypothetical protein
MMARAIDPDTELPLLRSDGQRSKIYLAISKPKVVFEALINQEFTSWDDVNEVTWDGLLSGAYTNVIANMTLLVGSDRGGWDLGVARIRKDGGSSKLYIGRQSEVRFANNNYLTVINDFRPSARQCLVDEGDPLDIDMDEDIPYVAQNVETEPVAIMGPDAVVWRTDATVTHQRDGSGSWSPDGHSVTYLWSADGPTGCTAVTFSPNNTVVNPTLTFTTVGEYLITLTITNATHTDKKTTAHRRTFVFGGAYLPVINFDLDAITDSSNDGMAFQVTLHDNSVLSGTYDQPKIILFAGDTYGDTIQSLGPLEGYENVIAWGWADNSSIEWAPNHSTVTLNIMGPAFWMGQIDILVPGSLKTGSGSWLVCPSVTIDMILWSLFHWRSNLDTLIDIFPSDDPGVASELTANNGSLWGQLTDIANHIFATPHCDRYGRLNFSVDPQMIPYPRSSIPIVMDIIKTDWHNKIIIDHRPRAVCSQIILEAMNNTDSYFSKAPGKIVMRWGSPQTKDNVLTTDQAQTNQLAGDYLAWLNNLFPSVIISLRANNRFIGISPNQYVTLSIAADDTPLGLVWTAKRLIVRRITYKREVKTGLFTADLECEAETIGYAGVTYIPPTVPPISTPPGPNGPGVPGGPGGPSYNPPAFTGPSFFKPPDYLNLEELCKSANPGSVNGPHGLTFSPNSLLSGESATALFPCWIRQANSYGETKVRVSIRYQGVGLPTYYLEAIDGSGNPVLAPSSFTVYADYIIFTFAPVSGIAVAGFRLTVYEEPEGGFAAFSYYSKGCQEHSWPIQDGHARSPDNSLYLGAGYFQCAATGDYNDFHYWLALHLIYAGASLPAGHLNCTIAQILGNCTMEWDGNPGFQFGLEMSDLPLTNSGSGSNNWYPPIGTWTASDGAWTPGVAIDKYGIFNFGFHSILTTCLFRITSLDWIVSDLVYANLYPGVAISPRRVFLDSASVYNICAP